MVEGVAAKPESSLARLVLGVIFLYHGLVPKILFLSQTEIRMIQAHGISWPPEQVALVAGVAEMLLGLALIFLRSSTWPILVALGSLVLLLIDVAIFSPELLVEAFNPVSTNLAAIGLCVIALAQHKERLKDRSHYGVEKCP